MPATNHNDAAPTFWVRDIPVYGDLILSPMDGYSGMPFRSICRDLGSAMSYTEFVNAMDVRTAWWRVDHKLVFLPQERPVVFQIFDNDPARLLEAALRLQELGPDIIDINMGCCDKSVSSRGAGAGLLRTPSKIAQIFSSLSKALTVPLTGKIRLGWNDESRNYLQVARIVQDNGGALLAVHGRTRAQTYKGSADWDAIAEVRQAISIPVIANGDVRTVADIERIKAHTGCPAVMIGRAALSNPWIFARLDRAQVPQELLHAMILRHLQRSMDFYGPERGLVLFRKYAAHYLRPLNLSRDQRQRLFTTPDPVEFQEIIVSLAS